MTATKHRALLDVLQEANRALSRCWIFDRPPTREEGLDLHSRATSAYADLVSDPVFWDQPPPKD